MIKKWRSTGKRLWVKGTEALQKTDIALRKGYNWRWHQKAEKRYGLKHFEPQRLVFVLGLARSGTTWLANTLARTQTPIRYFEEPLYGIRPKLFFSLRNDMSSLSCDAVQSDLHRFFTAYKLLTCPEIMPADFRPRSTKFRRNDPDFESVLVKEVHSLMASQNLLAQWKRPTIFITRSPEVVVDSVFQFAGYNTIYLKEEYRFLKTSTFLDKYFPAEKEQILSLISEIDKISNFKKRILLEKALTVYLIQHLFWRLAKKYSNLKIVQYEALIENPDKEFNEIASFLGLEYEKGNFDFSKNTDKKTIKKHTPDLKNRKMKVLSEQEVFQINELIKKSLL